MVTRDQLVNALALEIDPEESIGPDARALAVEIVDLVHDRGVGDIGDIRAALKRLARHFPRTMPEATR